MKTLLLIGLKMLAVVGLGLIMFHFWPVTVVPFAVALLLVLVFGALLLAGLCAVGAAGVGAIAGLFVAGVVLLVLLSPVWIPLAVLWGIIWLVRQSGSSKPQAARSA
jgi:hypothetical protein